MPDAMKEMTTNNTTFHNIKSDLGVLKDDAATTVKDAALLARNLKSQSGTLARDGIQQLKSAGQSKFERAEEHIRHRPGQSVALAFCAGLVLSYLMKSHR